MEMYSKAYVNWNLKKKTAIPCAPCLVAGARGEASLPTTDLTSPAPDLLTCPWWRAIASDWFVG